MIKPLQTEATIAREKYDHLFADDPDRCTDEPAPAPAGGLLNNIDPQQPRGAKLRDDASAMLREFSSISKNVGKCRERRFDAIVRKTAPAGSSGSLLSAVEIRYTHGLYWDESYKTLALIRRGSFIKWPQIGPDGKTKYKQLTRCLFYPALITETMRMAFVRATKEQITYFREEAVKSSAQRVGNTLFKVAIRFPKENTRHSNIIIKLEHASGGEECRLEFLFDGEQFHLNDIVSSAPFYDNGFDALIKKELIGQPEVLNEFLKNCFKPFRFKELDVICKNLEDYLCDCRYKVGLTEAVGTDFFIIQKDNRAL